MFYHALQIEEEGCIGCSRCMKICPTEAIRIFDGKASIQEHRCIDCGKCMEKCPYELNIPVLLRKNYEDYKKVLAGEISVS